MKINSNKIKSLFLLSLVGSNLAKEEKTDNQSELTLNSLPQITTNFTKRENETDPTLVFGGYPISIGDWKTPSCSFGFAVVSLDVSASSHCTWGFLSGFITSDNCCYSSDCDFKDVFLNSEDKTKVGHVLRTSFDYIKEPAFRYRDYAFVANSNLTKLIPYVAGEKGDLIPIISYGPASIGERVCAYTAATGRMCGKVVSVDEEEDLHTRFGKIILEVGGFGGFDENDYGGSVYKENSIANRTIAQLVGHINSLSYESNKNDKEPVYSIYYVPVEETLRLLATKENCPMAPLVYNETNAQEYDQLIAQIEIPAKK